MDVAVEDLVRRTTQNGVHTPRVVRLKDRVSVPLANGYRDVLLNVRVPNCPLVVELQLHFTEIHEIKPMAHRVYKLLRAVGWDEESARAQQMANMQRANEYETNSMKYLRLRRPMLRCKNQQKWSK